MKGPQSMMVYGIIGVLTLIIVIISIILIAGLFTTMQNEYTEAPSPYHTKEHY